MTRQKLWQRWPRNYNRLRRLGQAVRLGNRAWNGATWGILLITVLGRSVNAYYAFAPAGTISFVLGTLVPLIIVALVVAILVGLGGLL